MSGVRIFKARTQRERNGREYWVSGAFTVLIGRDQQSGDIWVRLEDERAGQSWGCFEFSEQDRGGGRGRGEPQRGEGGGQAGQGSTQRYGPGDDVPF